MSNFEENYQRKHKRLSLLKSAIRIGTCFGVLLMPMHDLSNAIAVLALGLLISEIVGVFEEFI